MEQNKFYLLSPFDNDADRSARLTAITILFVYSAILVAGVIGHICVIAFLLRRMRYVHHVFVRLSQQVSSVVGNLTAATNQSDRWRRIEDEAKAGKLFYLTLRFMCENDSKENMHGFIKT